MADAKKLEDKERYEEAGLKYNELEMWDKTEDCRKKLEIKTAENFEKSGRYEDAARIFDDLEMWEKAGDCRRMLKTNYVVSANVNIGRNGSISMECPHCGASQHLITKTNEVICQFCGKDFGDEGAYCSKECEEKVFDETRPTCPVCNNKIKSNGEEHHLQYGPPEEKTFVHASCHYKIHHTDMYPNFKPKDKSPYGEKKTRLTKAMKEAKLQKELKTGIAPDEYCIVCLKRYRKSDITIMYEGWKIHQNCIPKREPPKKGKFYFM